MRTIPLNDWRSKRPYLDPHDDEIADGQEGPRSVLDLLIDSAHADK